MESHTRKMNIELLCQWFDYDPVKGLLIRKLKMRSDAYDIISPERPDVYFLGRHYDYATICWIIYHKKLPRENYIIEHKDRHKSNHKIENLREATLSQNMQNVAGHGKYSKGVSCRFDGSRKKPFQTRIRISTGERILLGSFETEEEAAEAYRQAALKYHGEFACVE